jgi:glycosyltransferase involved in cell wall biosynthesis
MVEELIARGWEVTLLAEQFADKVESAREVRLVTFFRRGVCSWLGRMGEILMLCRLVGTKPAALVIVQGDLPRVTYVLLQFIVPLIFIRQDGILTCPGNNRFLRRSRATCRRPAGVACLTEHRAEGCLGRISLWQQVGRVMFRMRDRLLLSCIRHFVTSSRYLGRVHRRPARVLYPPLMTRSDQTHADSDENPKFETRNPKQIRIKGSVEGTGKLLNNTRVRRYLATPSVDRDLRRLVFCGRLEEVKGAGEAISVLSLLPESYHLEILGEGAEGAHLARLVQELELRSRVTFLGWVDGMTRDRVMASAGALLMPSLWDEAFGMAGIEAMAQGTPVVAYDVGGISEWCRNGAGVRVRCGDIWGAARAVEELTGDRVRWAVYSRAARQVAERDFPPRRFGHELDLVLSEAREGDSDIDHGGPA